LFAATSTSRTKPLRLRQVWRPGLADEGDRSPEPARPQQVTEPSSPALGGHDSGYHADQPQPVTPVTIRPHDPRTGEEIDTAEVVKGYEYDRGRFVTGISPSAPPVLRGGVSGLDPTLFPARRTRSMPRLSTGTVIS
jgi:hypothetical protein